MGGSSFVFGPRCSTWGLYLNPAPVPDDRPTGMGPAFLEGARVWKLPPTGVQSEQLAFARETAEEKVIVLVNAAPQAVSMEVSVPAAWGNLAEDLLNPGENWRIKDGEVRIVKIWPYWSRILRITTG